MKINYSSHKPILLYHYLIVRLNPRNKFKTIRETSFKIDNILFDSIF